jgi:hypothetical protein
MLWWCRLGLARLTGGERMLVSFDVFALPQSADGRYVFSAEQQIEAVEQSERWGVRRIANWCGISKYRLRQWRHARRMGALKRAHFVEVCVRPGGEA